MLGRKGQGVGGGGGGGIVCIYENVCLLSPTSPLLLFSLFFSVLKLLSPLFQFSQLFIKQFTYTHSETHPYLCWVSF